MSTVVPMHGPKIRQNDLQTKLGMSAAEIGLSVRTTNCLEEAGIFTVEQLLHHTQEELMQIPNFGPRTLSEIFRALEPLGFVRKTRGQ